MGLRGRENRRYFHINDDFGHIVPVVKNIYLKQSGEGGGDIFFFYVKYISLILCPFLFAANIIFGSTVFSYLILDVFGTDHVDSSCVHGDQAAHRQDGLGRLAQLSQVLLEDLYILRVEEDVDLLVLLVLVLYDAHVVVEVAGNLALHADQSGPEEDLAPQVQDKCGPVFLCKDGNM